MFPFSLMNEIRNLVDGRALQAYTHCPQHYAYKYLYDIPDTPQTISARYSLAARRTVMGIARTQCASGSVTPKRASMVWQLAAQHYGLDGIPKWSHRGRAVALWFQKFTTEWQILNVGVEHHFPIKLHPNRIVDVAVTADFVAQRKAERVHILVVPPRLGPLKPLVGNDNGERWGTWSLDTQKYRVCPPAEAGAVVEQALRGMIRKIVWPYYDGRCRQCPYTDVCKTEDAQPYRLRDKSKRERVRQRVQKARNCGSI
jgi:hypothetical protein